MPATATDRLAGLTTSIAVKPPCVAVTAFDTPLTGLYTVGTVVLEEGDRVLVRAQTDASQNGIYNASTSDWTRALDFDGARDAVAGTLVLVRNQIIQGAMYEVLAASEIIIGETDITFELRDDPTILYAQTQHEIDANVVPVRHMYPPGNVLRYGADSTGADDSAAAFNFATLSQAVYTLDGTLNEIVVPPGKYRIDGTVYVRKGQRLVGSMGASYIIANNVGSGATFKMGWGNSGGVPAVDGGGQPCSIENLFLLGGPSAGVVDFTTVAGGAVRNCFFSSPALGISLVSSGDIQITDSFIDQGLTGISINGGGNIQIDTLSFFNTRFDISISGIPYATQVNNCHFEFNQFTSVLFSDGSTITNFKFSNCTWTWNVQYGTYQGAILNRASGTVASFENCTFRNMPGYAYIWGTGTGSSIEFANCTFDGTKELAGYASSTAAKAISTANEAIRCVGCTFRNIPTGAGNPLALAGSAVASILELEGCRWYANDASFSFVNITATFAGSAFRAFGCKGDRSQMLVNAQSATPISVRDCTDWFGVIATSGGSNYIQLPYQHANLYQVIVKANLASGGDANYRKIGIRLIEKNNDFTAGPVKTSFVSSATPITPAANSNGNLTITSEFGTVGGTASIPISNSGMLAISWPTSYANVTVDAQMLI
jgi:hypothetical protein